MHKDEEPLVLQELPKVLFLEMVTPMKKAYPNLPAQWFPMTPISQSWLLNPHQDDDKLQDRIQISRRGYPLQPDFSTTIDAATGQTIDASFPDLGDEFSLPS